jgi:hypothetical protein
MTDRHPALKGTSPYNDFLFAPIGDEPGGMRLSVLSALARSDVDPWEEAARLATLSSPDAQRNLALRLDPFLDKQRGPAAAESLAARLVALLPKTGEARTARATTIAGDGIRPTGEWVAWLCFAIAMVLLTPHHPATTTGTEEPVPTANATSPVETGEAKPAVSGVNTQPGLGHARVPAIPN